MPARITEEAIAGLRPQQILRDDMVRGFAVKMGSKNIATYFVRREGPNKLFEKIGTDDVIGVVKARKLAQSILARHTLDLPPERGKNHTLRSSWPLLKAHLARMHKSPKTIQAYDDALARLDPKVQDTRLRDLGRDPSIMAAEYDRICERSDGGTAFRQKGHGQPAADSSARFVRTLYRYVLRRHDPMLPAAGPCVDLDLNSKDPIHELSVMTVGDLPPWWRAVKKLENPLRHEMHLFSLLSGLRRGDLYGMRWEHQHADNPLLFSIPAPKGGRRRAFDLVLSGPMHACLKRALKYCVEEWLPKHGEFGWCWPGRGTDGHISGLESDKKRGVFCYLHGCRRTYASIARLAGVEEELLARLMNHRGHGRSITGHYIQTSAVGKLLRDAQEATSALIIKSIADPALAYVPEVMSAEDATALLADSEPRPR